MSTKVRRLRPSIELLLLKHRGLELFSPSTAFRFDLFVRCDPPYTQPRECLGRDSEVLFAGNGSAGDVVLQVELEGSLDLVNLQPPAMWKLQDLVRTYSEAQTGCPVTYYYSFREIEKLFEGFQIQSIRKGHIFPYVIEKYIQYQY